MDAPVQQRQRAKAGDVDTRPPLRLITCGSVDDGKSTLIGRLLYEQKLIFDDQLAALAADSRTFGTVPGEIDYALLLDGLEAEREQGITIDVAYRTFATPRRAFLVADTPGHEQYTRNMATGASNAELGFKDITCIPVSARLGDNVSARGGRMPWYAGPPLLAHLESVDVEDGRAGQPFRLPVQWVNRPHSDFRGYAGTIAGGSVKAGDEIVVLPSGQATRVKSILAGDGEIAAAQSGDAVTVTLAQEIDVARGDMLAGVRDRPAVADQFAAHLVWMAADKLFPGRSYLMKVNNNTLTATVSELKHRIDVDTLAKLAAKTLSLNEVGVANLSLARPIAFDPYAENRTTGAFIL